MEEQDWHGTCFRSGPAVFVGVLSLLHQPVVVLLQGPLRTLDVLCTPIAFPVYGPGAVIKASYLKQAPAPLRSVLPVDIFDALDALLQQYFGNDLLDTIGCAMPSAAWTKALTEYRSAVRELLAKMVAEIRETLGDGVSPEVDTVLSDMDNKLSWIFNTACLGTGVSAHWPLLTPDLVLHVHASVWQTSLAWAEVCFPFPSHVHGSCIECRLGHGAHHTDGH